MPVVRFNGKKLDPATIRALVSGTLVNGSKPSVWWNRQSLDFRNSFMDTMRTSMRNGESLTQAITRVVGGTVDGVTVPGIMKTTKARAGALAATAQSAVSNEAALKTFQANNDVIKAVTQVSTLDNKTSDICVAYSGQTWDVSTLAPVMGGSLPFNGGPPRHFNCRSRLRPVTKSFKELGVDKAEIPPGTRASMDGQVPADITFNKFLRGKSTQFQDDLLGPARARLWRNGDINLTQLVDMRGNPMTLRQLEDLVGIKPKPKFNPATNRTVDVPKTPSTTKKVESFLDDVKITEAEHAEITAHAKRLVSAADDADVVVTNQVKALADDVGAKFPDAPIVKDGPDVFEGSLNFRMKDIDSTSRKIQTYARDRNLTFTEAADQISDSLRYTYVLDEDGYVKAIQEIMEKFAELGYKNNKFDPAWLLRPDYKGLNINLVSPQGVRIELQLHTARSFEVKNTINHTLYEKFRKLTKAKQKGAEGQALQAEMLANAQAIPVPKNIKFLEDLAKIYNKPDVKQQAKIFAEAKARQLDAVTFQKVQEFNSIVSARLTEGNLELARKVIEAADDVISAKVKKSALARIEQVRKKAVKEADEIIKKKEFATLSSKNEFNARFLEVLDEIDESGLSQATRLEVTDQLKKLKASKVEDFATEDLFNFQLQGEFKKAKEIAKTITKPSPKFRKIVKELEADHVKTVEKNVLLQLDNGDSVTALKTLLDFGDISKVPKLKKLSKEIQKGQGIIDDTLKKLTKADADDFDKFTALVKKEINDSDIPNWMRNKILNDPKFAAAEESAKFKPVVKLAEKTLIEGDLTKVKELLNTIPLSVEGRSKLSQAFMTATQKKADIIKIEFPKKVKEIATKELGFSVADIELLSTSIDDLAIMMDGIITDTFKVGLRKQLGAGRAKLREAMGELKNLNKASKGVDALVDFASSLDQKLAHHPEFQAVIKKVTKQAQKKASAARTEVMDAMIKSGQLDADDIITFGETVLKEALKDVNKKLGKAQLKAKITEIRVKIANAKKSDVSVVEFVADGTDYDKTVLKLLEGEGGQQKKLNEAIQLFKKNGDDPQARSKLFDMLQGRTKSEQRALKEFVHKRVNPKSLATGQNWDSAVADVVARHVNNASASDIQKYISSLTDGLTDGMKTNFNQTIFTRAGVKNIDDLGVVVEGEATPAVLRIRESLKLQDKGNEFIPEHTIKERLEAAKSWLNSGNTTDTEFFAQSKRTHNSILKQSHRTIKDGDRMFGENSWGISPQDWKKWVDDVAPTLDDWDIALINQYTGGMAGRINAGLYNGGFQTVDTAGARALNSALDKMPKHTGTVYRGTSPRDNWSADFVDARYEVGKTVTERGFGSAATQEPAAFSGPIRFIIHTKGKQGAIMGHIGGYGTKEMEVLFKAGSKFRVLRKRRNGQSITVTMEEV